MKKLNVPSKVILFCDGSKCGKENKTNKKQFKQLIKENGLKEEVFLLKTHCTDNCKCAPVISIQPDNIWFGEVSEKKIPELFDLFIQKE